MIKTRGFTLIEVLISMVILSIGLLGLASLQMMSLRDNMDAYNYQQATLLGNEMQDRIRSNNIMDVDPTFSWTTVTANQGNSCSDPTSPCTPAQLAAFDFWYWESSVTKVLPAPKATSDKRVEIKQSSLVMKGSCKTPGSSSICLITQWKRANASKTGRLSGNATYYLEMTI